MTQKYENNGNGILLGNKRRHHTKRLPFAPSRRGAPGREYPAVRWPSSALSSPRLRCCLVWGYWDSTSSRLLLKRSFHIWECIPEGYPLRNPAQATGGSAVWGSGCAPRTLAARERLPTMHVKCPPRKGGAGKCFTYQACMQNCALLFLITKYFLFSPRQNHRQCTTSDHTVLCSP